MKIKDVFNIAVNKTNNQEVFTLKKKKLKSSGFSKYDLINMELKDCTK